MVIFFLIVGLIVFLLLVAYFWQKEEMKNLPDDPNYVEPKMAEEEEDL